MGELPFQSEYRSIDLHFSGYERTPTKLVPELNIK